MLIYGRRGIPLPPFPKPTHGPEGSGLLPYVSIGDALEKLERLGQRDSNDLYHQPKKMTVINGQPYDPYSRFINCIMTSGVTNLHPSGKRNFTTRELALLQSLPHDHCLTGSQTTAIKQIGNMFPPVMAEIVYRTCAQTLEAFDNGFITAEDEIEDLDITLIEKGVVIPELLHRSNSPFSSISSHAGSQYLHRYLRPSKLSDAVYAYHSSAWQERQLTSRKVPQGRSSRPSVNMFDHGEPDFGTRSPSPLRERKRAMPHRSEEVIYISSDSE
jgi:DNA (cytosine-5)-methyltransferase 1